MLKTLIQKDRWVAIGLVVLGAVVFVTYKEHTATQEYERDREARCISSFPLDHKKEESCKYERDSPNNYLPWWYVLVAWPDGITTWAIIATGLVIAWQSNETRRSAKAAEVSAKISERALIAQFRPKVIIRKMRLDPPSFIFYDRRNDGEWRILIQLANVGGTKATVLRGIGYFQEYRGGSPHDELSRGWFLDGPIVINPGEYETIEYALDAAKFRTYMRILEASTKVKGKQPPREPVFHGAFAYVDESGVQRETGFGRRWDVMEEKFVPLDDPNFEYQD